MRRSPLHEQHVKLGAVFTDVTGWEIPARYGDAVAEYQSVRNNVGIADLAPRGRLRVTGEDRVTWLQSLISNDLRPLSPGTGVYSSFLSHKGKMLSYFRAYVEEDAVLLEDVGEIGDTTHQALRKFLLFGTKAKLENCAETWGLLLLAGPRTGQLVDQAFGKDISSLKPLEFVPQEIEGHRALLMRTEETGETDVEIFIPAEGLTALWELLWDRGRQLDLRAFGTEAREMLRLEAGIPRAGADLTDAIVPPEANLEGKAFSLTKGCYPGQEVVARMDTYGSVRRRLTGLVLADPLLPPPGSKLFSGDREVGWTSSATHSPALASSIAFGFPLRDFTQPGTELTVEIAGQHHKAVVHALPFYKKP